MSNVIELNRHKNVQPRFTIEAMMNDEGGWSVQILEFYDDDMPSHEAFREVAAALIPIAGGLIHNAEALEPTKQGCIVSNIMIYNNGHIEMHTQPLSTEERRQWLLTGLKSIKKYVRSGRWG